MGKSRTILSFAAGSLFGVGIMVLVALWQFGAIGAPPKTLPCLTGADALTDSQLLTWDTLTPDNKVFVGRMECLAQKAELGWIGLAPADHRNEVAARDAEKMHWILADMRNHK